jgi:hypothetical protein
MMPTAGWKESHDWRIPKHVCQTIWEEHALSNQSPCPYLQPSMFGPQTECARCKHDLEEVQLDGVDNI